MSSMRIMGALGALAGVAYEALCIWSFFSPDDQTLVNYNVAVCPQENKIASYIGLTAINGVLIAMSLLPDSPAPAAPKQTKQASLPESKAKPAEENTVAANTGAAATAATASAASGAEAPATHAAPGLRSRSSS